MKKPIYAIDLEEIEDKLTFINQCIDEIKQQVMQRGKQKDLFLSELEQKVCTLQSEIYQLVGEPQRLGALEREIQDLEREKRQQKLDCWRDVNALKRELRQLKKEYRAVMVSYKCLNPKN